jgi:hypothetical protein
MVAMSDEVERTLSALDLDDEFAAAAALARVYAGQLDSARDAEKAADRVLTAARRQGEDDETVEMIQALRAKLSARQTVVNIGPRLAELLGRLLATPKDAGASKPVDTQSRPATRTGSLAMLRGGKTG